MGSCPERLPILTEIPPRRRVSQTHMANGQAGASAIRVKLHVSYITRVLQAEVEMATKADTAINVLRIGCSFGRAFAANQSAIRWTPAFRGAQSELLGHITSCDGRQSAADPSRTRSGAASCRLQADAIVRINLPPRARPGNARYLWALVDHHGHPLVSSTLSAPWLHGKHNQRCAPIHRLVGTYAFLPCSLLVRSRYC